MATPAVLYAAKSTQDKHLSIPKQLQDGREKSADEGWVVVGGKGVGEFWDEGFSAYSGNRGPDLKRAEEAAEKAAVEFGTTAMLVVQHSDRLARGAGDRPGASDALTEVWHRLRRKDVHVRSFQNDVMMSRPVLVAVASEQAYEESERKSKAVGDGMARQVRERGHAIGRAPIGYVRIPKEGLAIDSEWAPLVRRIFDEWVGGKPQIQIARDLNREGITTPRGKPWRQTAVRLILKNCVYVGRIEDRSGETFTASHEPIVPLEVWEKAQAMRTSKSQAFGPGRPTAGTHLFTHSLLRCECGWAMRPRTIREKKNSREYIREVYVCEGANIDSDTCGVATQKRAPIDAAVFNYFASVGLDMEGTREQLANAYGVRLAEAEALVGRSESDAQRAEEKLARIRRDYTEGVLSAEDWASFRDELSGELEGARAEVERLTGRVAELRESAAMKDIERDSLAKLADLRAAVAGEVKDAEGVEAVRAALTRLFECFIVRQVRPGTRIHADLAWQEGGLYLDPVALPQAVEGFTDLRPVFRREPVYGGETNSREPTPSTRSKPSTPRPT